MSRASSGPGRLGSLFTLALGLPLVGCHHAPELTSASPKVTVPKGCERNLSGEYVHADNASYRYLGQDDGGTLVLLVRRENEDGGTAPDADPGNTRIVLGRTAGGFVGQVRSVARNANKSPCPITLPAQVLGCDAQGLSLRAAEGTAVNEACQQPPPGAVTAWVEQRLLRRDAGTP